MAKVGIIKQAGNITFVISVQALQHYFAFDIAEMTVLVFGR
jgi:hypothetical protein